jgi:hypothetical protein
MWWLDDSELIQYAAIKVSEGPVVPDRIMHIGWHSEGQVINLTIGSQWVPNTTTASDNVVPLDSGKDAPELHKVGIVGIVSDHDVLTPGHHQDGQ